VVREREKAIVSVNDLKNVLVFVRGRVLFALSYPPLLGDLDDILETEGEGAPIGSS
jgi:hypothetical protein